MERNVHKIDMRLIRFSGSPVTTDEFSAFLKGKTFVDQHSQSQLVSYMKMTYYSLNFLHCSIPLSTGFLLIFVPVRNGF